MVWKQLQDLILEKKDYIQSIITGCEKEKQTLKAQDALQQFAFLWPEPIAEKNPERWSIKLPKSIAKLLGQ